MGDLNKIILNIEHDIAEFGKTLQIPDSVQLQLGEVANEFKSKIRENTDNNDLAGSFNIEHEILAELDRIAEGSIATDTNLQKSPAPQAFSIIAALRSGKCLVDNYPLSNTSPDSRTITPSPTHTQSKTDTSLASAREPYPTCPAMRKFAKRGRADLARVFKSKWVKLKKDFDKTHRAFVTADMLRPGFSLAFSLNLSADLQATLKTHTKPKRLMSHYINREMKKLFGSPLPYAFIFEYSKKKLHIHGVVIPSIFDLAHINAIDEALKKAGGELPSTSRNTQTELSWLYNGHGWFKYATKAKRAAKGFFDTMDEKSKKDDEKLVYVSGPLRNLCNEKEDRAHHRELSGYAVTEQEWMDYQKKAGKLLTRIASPRRATCRVPSLKRHQWPLPVRRVCEGIYRLSEAMGAISLLVELLRHYRDWPPWEINSRDWHAPE